MDELNFICQKMHNYDEEIQSQIAHQPIKHGYKYSVTIIKNKCIIYMHGETLYGSHTAWKNVITLLKR